MTTHCQDYNFSAIEAHWQQFWRDNHTFAAKDFAAKPKFYLLDMFPYPSGAGLHMGHPVGYTASDILARYKMAQGYNVLHPMGWDAFGLPAEQHAIKTGVHPATNTAENIVRFRQQIDKLGFGFAWEREVNSTHPDYYRWTQWIFLQLFKHGLAYVDEKPVWWCPALGTVLANEEVVEGRSERGNHPVERRNLRQWVLRITAYADKLLQGLTDLDWPDSTKRQQQAWIGRSEGAEILFPLADQPEEASLKVFTTCPHTLFGVTYMVIAPEHPQLAPLTTAAQRDAVTAYVEQAKAKSDLERTDLAKDKTGVFTGAYALHPLTQQPIPVWVADYVLISYGTGTVMAVPAHDQRDYEFAQKFSLPITPVVQPADPTELPADQAYTGPGTMINSGQYNGMDAQACQQAITADLEAAGLGHAAVNYKLRDWLFSRQRYWGEPFPILWLDEAAYQQLQQLPTSPLHSYLPSQPVSYVDKQGNPHYAVPVADTALPVELPEVSSFQPTGDGQSPLTYATDWVECWLNLNTGQTTPASQTPPQDPGPWVRATRETNTMPQWAGSCWYYLRYLDPHNTTQLLDPKLEAYWGMPDLYIGGAEHAVLHLLYARFWHRFLFDIGVVSQPEPFRKLFHQGLLLGEDQVKMSKSRGNTVDPLSIIDEYGSDTLRLFLMFLSPLEDMKPWNSQGIEGIARFLRKIWREYITRTGAVSDKITAAGEEDPTTLRLLHETIKKVTHDIENLRLNTAISQLMIFANHLQKTTAFTRTTALSFVQLLAPFAPHLAEELWGRLGEAPSIVQAPWPQYDECWLVAQEMKIAVQVNGKVRGDILISKASTKEAVLAAAKELPRVQTFLNGKAIKKEIYVPGKIVNLVAS